MTGVMLPLNTSLPALLPWKKAYSRIPVMMLMISEISTAPLQKKKSVAKRNARDKNLTRELR